MALRAAPDQAIVIDQSRQVVYVIDAQNIAHARAITPAR